MVCVFATMSAMSAASILQIILSDMLDLLPIPNLVKVVGVNKDLTAWCQQQPLWKKIVFEAALTKLFDDASDIEEEEG